MNANKNIWIVSHSCGSPTIGPNMRVFLLGKNLSKKYIIRIYASRYFHKYLNQPKGYINYSERFKIIYLINLKYKNFIGQFLNQLIFPVFLFIKFLKDLKNCPPKVIVLSSPPPFAIISITPFLKIFKIKLIVDVRDLWPEILIAIGNDSLPFKAYLFMVKKMVGLAYAQANHIISVKQGDLDYIKINYKTKAKLHFIPNAYTEEKTLFDDSFRHSFLDGKYFVVTYTGALSDYYTLDELIDVAEKCLANNLKIRFLIAGGGKDLEKYKNKSVNLSNVDFIGQKQKTIINSILSKADIAYLPLKENSFNNHGISTNKLYDYMFHALPVLGLYQNNYDIVEKHEFGFVEKSYCSNSLYEKLIELYEMDTDRRKAMGLNGKILLEREFLPEYIAQKFEKIINE